MEGPLVKLSLVTDCLGHMSEEEMMNTAKSLGYETLELCSGNWSSAPHLDLDGLLDSKIKRTRFLDLLKKEELTLAALNCSGNQLAPNEGGKKHQLVVEKTFRLAELLEIDTIIMMSGLPGGGPNDTTSNWITTSWPPNTSDILNWQWNEVALPYWERTIKVAEEHGIRKIALENHGSQLVYNPETLFKLRNHVGEIVGMNLDPSHLFWMGGDPILAARVLDNAIYHVHAKDVRFERGIYEKNGLLDTKSVKCYPNRSWNFVTLGSGHGIKWWKEFFSVISMTGYNGPISLELEDQTMDSLTGLTISTKVLKESLPRIID